MIKFRQNIYLTFVAENCGSLKVIGNVYEHPELIERMKSIIADINKAFESS